MKSIVKVMTLSAAVAFGLGVNAASAQHEHGEEAGRSHARAKVHGGVVTMSKEFYVETVFMPDQVRLYLYDSSQNPMHVKHWKRGLVEAVGVVDFRARGTATLKFVRGTPVGYACPMCAGQESTKPGKCSMCGMDLVKQKIPDGSLWSCPMHPDKNGKAVGKCGDCGMKYTPQDYLVATADLSGLKAGDARVTFNLKNLPGKSERTLRFTEKLVLGHVHEEHKEGERGHGGHDHGD